MFEKYKVKSLHGAERVENETRENVLKMYVRHDCKVDAIAAAIATMDYITLVNMLTFTKHSNTDKMRCMYSLSTACALNEFCLKRIASGDKNVVCTHCFSVSVQGMRPTLKRSLARNAAVLHNVVIPVQAWKACKALQKLVKKGVKVFRIESFGDTANLIHAENYINMCKAFPEIHFTIWSKNIWIWADAFKAYGKPENMTYIHSSLYVNHVDNIPGRYMTFVDHRFTVYTREYHEKNNIIPNCCNGREKRYCVECMHCYGHNAAERANLSFDIIETLR